MRQRCLTLPFFASLAPRTEPALTFRQSDPKCRLFGNLYGPLKTGVGQARHNTMAVSLNYISGRVHVGRTCTIHILHRPVLAGAGTTVLSIVYVILISNSRWDRVVTPYCSFIWETLINMIRTGVGPCVVTLLQFPRARDSHMYGRSCTRGPLQPCETSIPGNDGARKSRYRFS